jgi:choline dehydrogenase-like flavoprotein
VFLDGRQVDLDRPVEADVCVVGAGAAGISIAAELVDSHLSVVLVESGGFEAESDSPSAYHVVPGKRLTLGVDQRLPLYFGGNTNTWAGNCRPLDDVDFERRDWIPYSGWPIKREDLVPYYERAQALSGLKDFRWYDLDAVTPYLEHPPLDVDSGLLATRIVHTCPVPSFARLHRERLEGAADVRVLLHAHAVGMEVDKRGERVDAVQIVASDGRRGRVEAGTVILAGGGVENARLLLCSGGSRGLGNEFDLVGRFFMEHWFVELPLGGWDTEADLSLYDFDSGAPDHVDGVRVWAQLALSENLLRQRRVPALSMWFRRLPRTSPSVAAVRRLGASMLGRAPVEVTTDLRLVSTDPAEVPRHIARRLGRRGSPGPEGNVLRLQIEQTPHPENRLSLASAAGPSGERMAELALRLRNDELKAHMESLRIAAEAIGLNAGRIVKQARLMFDAGRVGFFWHHMGTTRMHADPAQGVVDTECRVHGLTNLFIAGSSVFPTGGIGAPTLTIVALSIRLADRVRQG